MGNIVVPLFINLIDIIIIVQVIPWKIVPLIGNRGYVLLIFFICLRYLRIKSDLQCSLLCSRLKVFQEEGQR